MMNEEIEIILMTTTKGEKIIMVTEECLDLAIRLEESEILYHDMKKLFNFMGYNGKYIKLNNSDNYYRSVLILRISTGRVNYLMKINKSSKKNISHN